MKKNKFVGLAIVVFLLMAPSSLYASGFLPQEARAMGMGGAGVAVGNSRQAHYYNPSLLVNAGKDEEYSFEVDTAVRISDSDKLLEAMEDLTEGKPFFELVATSERFDNAPTPANATALKNAVNAAFNGIESVGNKSLTFDLNMGVLFASLPNRELSWAAYMNVWGNFGWQGNLSANDQALLDDIRNIANAKIDNPTSAINLVSFEGSDLTSSFSIQGILVREFGISLAMSQQFSGYEFDIGITPKIQTVITSGEVIQLFSAENESQTLFSNSNSLEKTTFNFDVGVSKKIDENWRAGFMIKNLIPKRFEFSKLSTEATISPAVRMGIAYASKRFNAGVDFDLTENNDAATYTTTRFLALGAEIDVWLLKLRGGYRHNFAGSGGNSLSAGVGLYLFGLNVDAAVASNNLNPSKLTAVDNVNASVQVGLNW